MPSAAVVGATGYTGLELLRFLAHHPSVKVTHVYARQQAGQRLSDVYPYLGVYPLVIEPFDPTNLPKVEVLFLALPHGQTQSFIKPLLESGIKLIDLSADFRLKDPILYEQYYKHPHQAVSFLEKAHYGIPELYRNQIRSTQLCANPGCYATCSILGLYPLAKHGWISGTPVIDAKSGLSGAGKTLQEHLLLCEASEDFSAYGTGFHRHVPEIETVLGSPVLFSPHLVPMKRGMMASIYTDIPAGMSFTSIVEAYQETYRHEPFVSVHVDELPHTKHVAGTNHCRLSLKQVGQKLVIFSVIDNLGKGASGQAIQNMNIMLGLPETSGLELLPLGL